MSFTEIDEHELCDPCGHDPLLVKQNHGGRHSVVLRNLHMENGMVQGWTGNSTIFDSLISVMIASPLLTIALSTVVTLTICFVIAWKVSFSRSFIDLFSFQYCQDVKDVGINRSQRH